MARVNSTTAENSLPIDQTLQCVSCDSSFIFTAGEQVYFREQRLAPPKRCYPGRTLKRERNQIGSTLGKL